MLPVENIAYSRILRLSQTQPLIPQEQDMQLQPLLPTLTAVRSKIKK
jgi:hypothetical protein